MKRIDDKVLVSGQIAPADVAALKDQGVTMIVNNRSDGEEPGQPQAAEIEAATEACGIGYRHIPVGGGGMSAGHVQAMGEALEASEGQVLAFCKSGTRSTFLWALARGEAGDAAGEIQGKAAAAGYDISPILPYLNR